MSWKLFAIGVGVLIVLVIVLKNGAVLGTMLSNASQTFADTIASLKG